MSDYLEIVSTSSIESIDNCIICFYPLDKEIAQLSCGHKYHFDCLNSWANKKNNLDAIFITNSGSSNEKLMGLITISDITLEMKNT